MKASEVLRKAKGLIDHPSKWGKGYSWERGPKRLCLLVALYRVSDNCDYSFGHQLGITVSGSHEPTKWNDAPERTHAEVMEAFDKAIALAEAEEGVVARPTDAEIVGTFIAQQLEAVKNGEVIEYAEAK